MNATELRVFISERFSDDELRALAFDLGIPFEDLGAPDAGKTARVQALIEWCIRRGRVTDLERAARLARGDTGQRMADASGYVTTMDYAQVQRLIAVTDEMNRNMTKLVTDIEVLKLQVSDLQKQFHELEARNSMTQPTSWQTWFLGGVALVMIASIIATWLGR